jgi:hypothetical protein
MLAFTARPNASPASHGLRSANDIGQEGAGAQKKGSLCHCPPGVQQDQGVDPEQQDCQAAGPNASQVPPAQENQAQA